MSYSTPSSEWGAAMHSRIRPLLIGTRDHTGAGTTVTVEGNGCTMNNTHSGMPSITVRGSLKLVKGRDKHGQETLTITHSPMLTRDDARSYVGLGLNNFTTCVNEGLILKRGGNAAQPYHVDDLDAYLEHRREEAE